MKRYALFAWKDHLQMGGWCDFFDSYNTVNSAIAGSMIAARRSFPIWQVVDLATGKIVTDEHRERTGEFHPDTPAEYL